MIRLIINSNNYQNMTFYTKKPETIDFSGFRLFAIACVRGCCVPVARV